MAPIKFEEDIKNKLDKRTLQPSGNAWDKLSERLDNQTKKGHNKPVLWVGLAASIVGVLLVVSQFVNNETVVDSVPEIVVNPAVIEQNKPKVIAVEDPIDIENISKNIQIGKEKVVKESVKKRALVRSEFNKEQTAIAQESSTEKLNKMTINPDEVAQEPLTFEQKKILAVANQLQALKDNNAVTDDAINALLLEAQKEIRLNQLYREITGVVDANLLLQDVEAELDQSFRSKVFEAIKESYGTVKTAVAQRND